MSGGTSFRRQYWCNLPRKISINTVLQCEWKKSQVPLHLKNQNKTKLWCFLSNSATFLSYSFHLCGMCCVLCVVVFVCFWWSLFVLLGLVWCVGFVVVFFFGLINHVFIFCKNHMLPQQVVCVWPLDWKDFRTRNPGLGSYLVFCVFTWIPSEFERTN